MSEPTIGRAAGVGAEAREKLLGGQLVLGEDAVEAADQRPGEAPRAGASGDSSAPRCGR